MVYIVHRRGRLVAIILVRYCEIGLKSVPVRRRFENQLRDNMLSMFVRDGIEALVTFADARFYVETDDPDRCLTSLRRVFGIASVSVTVPCGSDLDEICGVAARFSRDRLSEGQSFAVRARREGTHQYTSQIVGREVGSAIFEENRHLGVRVDLTSPDRTFYVEIRNNHAYVFDEYIDCPGGLPVGTQGRVLADGHTERDVLSAWMMMKRGCRVIVRGTSGELLERYDPSLRRLGEHDVNTNLLKDIMGLVKGTSMSEYDGRDLVGDLPVFTPTIGMTDQEVSEMLSRIDGFPFSD